jgi:hypothetical protein
MTHWESLVVRALRILMLLVDDAHLVPKRTATDDLRTPSPLPFPILRASDVIAQQQPTARVDNR